MSQLLPLVRPSALRPGRSRSRLAAFASLLAVVLGVLTPSRAAATQPRYAPAQDHAAPQPAAPSAGPRRSAAPTPELAPDDVIAIVLDALAHNDPEDRGLAVVFAFASPVNRAAVGPLDRFSDLARDDAYRPLLGHVRAVRGAIRMDGERATQRVVVTTPSGDQAVYTFTLSRQSDGAYKGCWMTDGVTREPRSRLRTPQMA
jgi:hypothetical protein